MDEAEKNRRSKIINDTSEGIHPPFKVFYIASIIDVASRALSAFERFEELSQQGARDEAIVAAVHEALIHSAALSRFFWPIRDKLTTFPRGAKLRKHFNILDDSPLKDKYLRNALEHYDERLDEFLLEDHAGYFYPQSIVGPATLKEEQVTHIFRLVDPATETFVLLGKRYGFGDIRDAIQNVLINANQMTRGRLWRNL